MPTCSKCGQAIEWRRTSNGKWLPVDVATDEPHFPACKRALHPEQFTREYWAPREAAMNAKPFVTNPRGLTDADLYSGELPPW